MNIEFVKNHDMSNDLVSNWMPMIMDDITIKKSKAVSIQIFWDNAVGTLNGAVNIYITNNLNSKSLSATYNINTASNINNSIIVDLESSYSFIRIEYTANLITGGQLNANLNYIEV